jgi:hypothetical protein
MTTSVPKQPTRAMRRAASILQSKVIDARARFIRPRATTPSIGSANLIRPDFSSCHWKPEKPRHTLGPSLKSLPFVEMKGSGQRASPASFWKDIPTGKGRDDFKRGRRYAALAIAAIAADGCASWELAKIIKAIVVDAASRRAKGGKYSRTLPPAIDGFIHELSRQLCRGIAGMRP